MPGALQDSAKCPMCGITLAALVDETSLAGVNRTYYHERIPMSGRRKYVCRKQFTNFEVAQTERQQLEVRVKQ